MIQTTIHLAVPADSDGLSRLITRVIRSSNTADYDAAEIEAVCRTFTPERIAETMTRRDVFLAKQDGALVGTVSLGDGKLHALFVDPGVQGQGLGRRLVAHVEDRALAGGHAQLMLSSSITARIFYQRLGYRMIEHEPRAEGDTTLMSKPLGVPRGRPG